MTEPAWTGFLSEQAELHRLSRLKTGTRAAEYECPSCVFRGYAVIEAVRIGARRITVRRSFRIAEWPAAISKADADPVRPLPWKRPSDGLVHGYAVGTKGGRDIAFANSLVYFVAP
jgi:hypothetical protein